MFENQSILVTGGTGSFGKRFVKRILENYPSIKRLVVFSRDEYKQYQIQKKFPAIKYPQLECILGNVRDYERVLEVFQDIDIVVHAAALKQVDTSERNPMEFIKTNILGAENIIKAAKKTKVKKVIAISSDKAVLPVSLYGATKLCADKLFLTENNSNTLFSVVRYGNVIGARGSVIPLFLSQAKTQSYLTLTDPTMTRFLMPIGSEVDIVLDAINMTQGQEIFIAKCPSATLQDIALAICPNCNNKIIGLRAGEKLHEEMIAANDSSLILETKKYYISLPKLNKDASSILEKKLLHYSAKKVKDNFKYHSGDNYFLNSDEIKKQIEALKLES